MLEEVLADKTQSRGNERLFVCLNQDYMCRTRLSLSSFSRDKKRGAEKSRGERRRQDSCSSLGHSLFSSLFPCGSLRKLPFASHLRTPRVLFVSHSDVPSRNRQNHHANRMFGHTLLCKSIFLHLSLSFEFLMPTPTSASLSWKLEEKA